MTWKNLGFEQKNFSGYFSICVIAAVASFIIS